VTIKIGDWDQYQQLVDIYRFYLDLAVKVSTGFWVIAGGVLTLVLSNQDDDFMVWALSIPILLAAGLVLALALGDRKARDLRDGVRRLAERLDLVQRVHAEILVWTLRGLFVGAVAVLLVLVVVWSKLAGAA